jgi:hypothetical protein
MKMMEDEDEGRHGQRPDLVEFACYVVSLQCSHHDAVALPSAPIPSIIQRISRRQTIHYEQ